MKKYIKNNLLLALVAVVVLATSCDKVKTVTPTTTEGKSYIKILKGGDPTTLHPEPPVDKKPIDFVPVPIKLLVLDLRRELATNADLNKTVTVVVKDDTNAVKVASSSYLQFPTAWFTLSGDGVKTGGQGGTFSFTFKPGEFAKQIYITIPDATVLNPSALYGLGFTIISADGGITVREKSLVVEIGAKNIYDGIYSVVSGNVTRYTAPGTVESPSTLNGPLAGNPDVYMITTGATTCGIPPAGSAGCLAWTFGSNSSVAGIDGLKVSVDPSTNLVTMTSAGNATLTNWAGKTNAYDPATKTFTLGFRWNPSANVREYEVVLKYSGPR